MKKIISVLFLTVLYLTGFGQDFAKFRMGFKINPNVSWMEPREKYIEKEGSLGNFGFGFIADIHFTPNYAIGTGVNIANTGGRLSMLQETLEGDVEYISNLNRKYRTQYVEIPLTFKLRTNEIGYLTYFGQFGIGLGTNIRSEADDVVDYLYEKVTDVDNGSVEWVKTDRTGYEDENINAKNDINLFRAAMIISMGVEYNLSGTTSIVGGITWNNGFTNVHRKFTAVKTDTQGEPLFNASLPEPQTYKLNAISNYLELNIGILF